MGYVGRVMARCGRTLIVLVVGAAMIGAGSGAVAAGSHEGGTRSAGDAGVVAQSSSRYLGRDVFAAVGRPSVGGNALTNMLFGLSGGVYLMNDAGADSDSGNASDTTGGDGSDDGVTRVDASAEALPWTVRVTYSLDGPQKTAAEVDGASGLVSVRVIVERNPLASRDIAAQAERLVPMIAFTVPSDIADDISANDGTIVARHGSDMLITAVGKAGGHVADDGGIVEDLAEGNIDGTSDRTVLDVRVYLTATKFSMSAVTFAAVPAGDAATFATQVDDLAARAASLTDSATGASSQGNDALITELTALRDHERELAKTTIAERTDAHHQAFDAYMAAYVGSYTTHLSGSLGTSTQLPALIGTAKELSGDTPLATAVVNLANAVNSVSAAHRHTGAADEVDAIIRRIRQQGTDGLVRELKQQAGTETSQGSKGYSDGQSQLSQAMIPYSMAYTDTYTKHLGELTGGTSAGAAAYQQQAIAATNADFKSVADLKDDQAKVDAAMSALATASEHTGKAQAIQQLLLRYEDEFENGDDSGSAMDAGGTGDASNDVATNAADDAGTGETDDSSAGNSAASALSSMSLAASRNGIAATVETKRQQALAKARRKAAAEQRKAQDAGQITSLVDDNVSMSKDDVMSFAGGVASIGGGAGTGKGSGSSASASSNGDGSAEAAGGTSDKSGTTGSSGGTGTDSAASDSGGSDSGANESGQSGAASSSNATGANGLSDSSGTASSAAVLDETPSVAYGMRGMGSATLLIPSGDDHVSETLAIGDSADVLTAAVKALQDNGKLTDLADQSNGDDATEGAARFLIVAQ